jgi:hypothetical protein
MSKTSQTSLTGSREIRRLAALDEINDRCRHAITLAGLLEAHGSGREAEPLDAEVVRGVGELILVEVRAMQVLVNQLWEETEP